MAGWTFDRFFSLLRTTTQSDELEDDVSEKINQVDDVFGVNRDLPLNYVFRADVDGKLLDCLSRNQHIVIYGSSKQGKTSLRKSCLQDDDYIVVSCQNRWTLTQLNSAILKRAGFKVELSESKTTTGEHKIILEFEGEGGLPFLAKAKGKTGFEGAQSTEGSIEYAALEIDPADTNDVIAALESVNFKKFIVLEDFHYLPEETQRDFSFSLKAFHEDSKFTFIIVGVWREENRLIAFNGDLTDRVISVDVDRWSPEHLREVIKAGEPLLNVTFDDAFREQLIERAFESVHIVQEACRKTLRTENVFHTQDQHKIVAARANVQNVVADVVAEHQGRYSGDAEVGDICSAFLSRRKTRIRTPSSSDIKNYQVVPPEWKRPE
ncbi:hypothetical protein N0B51_12770 [Tsuneonella sp. YG55]|uniref:Uncharacterized protein n=1 Tax=Tsuneonella litorea TaxID=2976475 RepID=A0A9X2W2M5_9SPHN|nr:hypothetical protein [Tsuneonella litorea]MCT2559850.1 hypothetical protein [Tsuneonella litorea]